MATPSAVKKFLTKVYNKMPIKITWYRKDKNSFLSSIFSSNYQFVKRSTFSKKIETLAFETNNLGAQPLWQGYKSFNKGGNGRKPDEVRTHPRMGEVFTQLVVDKKPTTVVEFGTAFGVSGMYFLAGLEQNGTGELLTFEPNTIWADIARNNLQQISNRFILTVGTFEENIGKLLTNRPLIDIAFIDAIHTKEFVQKQLEIVLSKASKNAIILLDDIDFSEDMSECWEEAAADPRFVSSVKLGNRVGILECR